MRLMKNSLIIVFLFIIAFCQVKAQDLAGTITYQQVTRYNFENIRNAHGDNQQTQDWIASLPEEGTTVQVLSFNSTKALFQEDDSEKDATPPGLQRALMYENSLKPPRQLVKQVYYDFTRNEKLVQVEYLTRFFLVQSDIQSLPWKLGSEKKKILEYTCMAATVNLKELEIVAWFAPEIPVPLGPSNYGGLPGMILAIERNGETAYLASSVNLDPPAEEALVKPEKGSIISEREFLSIQEKKEKEWKENPGGEGQNFHQ